MVTDQYTTASNGVTQIYLQQTYLDLSIVDATINVNVLADGTVFSANSAFVDAMTTGFWISVGFIAIGLAASLFLLPKQSRVSQVVRAEDEELSEVSAASSSGAPAMIPMFDTVGVE